MLIDASHPLVLGSGSPRRREIISALGLPFQVLAADFDELSDDFTEHFQ